MTEPQDGTIARAEKTLKQRRCIEINALRNLQTIENDHRQLRQGLRPKYMQLYSLIPADGVTFAKIRKMFRDSKHVSIARAIKDQRLWCLADSAGVMELLTKGQGLFTIRRGLAPPLSMYERIKDVRWMQTQAKAHGVDPRDTTAFKAFCEEKIRGFDVEAFKELNRLKRTRPVYEGQREV